MTDETEEISEAASSIIRVMPDVLANKIAAGEVVGRPASVVKELVENALDAGATQVQVILADSGRSLIQVVDDGCGMSPEDAERCFGRHATSKIREFEDLDRIQTLGFRGEALASIGSVARVELKTRRAPAEAGTMVRLEGGVVLSVEPCAQPIGTSMAVRQLFFNVPARRAFLKSDATELSHSVETVQVLALAHPEVTFSLHAEGKELLNLPAQKSGGPDGLAGRIQDLFGHDRKGLLWVEERTSYLSISGWVAQPEVRKKSRGEQFLLVNQRPIRSRYLEHAIYSSYRGLIPEGSFPFFVLNLEVDTRHVDVNVHPTKAEVKFDDERGIYSMLKAVAGRALSEGAGVLKFGEGVNLLAGGQGDGGLPDAAGRGLGGEGALDGTDLPGGTSDRSGSPNPFGDASHGYAMPSRPGSLEHDLYGPVVREAGGLEMSGQDVVPTESEPDKMVWQVLGSYIVAPIRSGLLVVDQHAAHERVIFERARKALEDGFGLSQQLLFPTVIEFSAADFALLEGLLPDLRAIGFDVAAMSGRSIMVRGLPADISTGDEKGVLAEVLDQYKVFAQRLQVRPRELLARALARRSAVPRESRLDPREMRGLIDQLFQCQEPYTSPSGQPTLIRITGEEFARRFGHRK